MLAGSQRTSPCVCVCTCTQGAGARVRLWGWGDSGVLCVCSRRNEFGEREGILRWRTQALERSPLSSRPRAVIPAWETGGRMVADSDTVSAAGPGWEVRSERGNADFRLSRSSRSGARSEAPSRAPLVQRPHGERVSTRPHAKVRPRQRAALRGFTPLAAVPAARAGISHARCDLLTCFGTRSKQVVEGVASRSWRMRR